MQNLILCLLSISNIKIQNSNTYQIQIFWLTLLRHIFYQGVSHSWKYTNKICLIFWWFLIFQINFSSPSDLLKFFVTFLLKFHRILDFFCLCFLVCFFFCYFYRFLKNWTRFFSSDLFLKIFELTRNKVIN